VKVRDRRRLGRQKKEVNEKGKWGKISRGREK